MKNLNRDLLVLLKNEFMTEKAIEQQVEYINEILLKAEAPESFCTAHELVNRNRITQDHHKIAKEAGHPELRPFRFLLNKN